MKELPIIPGAKVSFQSRTFTIQRVIDLNNVLLEDEVTHDLQRVSIALLEPVNTSPLTDKEKPLESISEAEWEVVKYRMQAIKPLLAGVSMEELDKIAKAHNVSRRTIFRWLSKHAATGTAASLINQKGGGKGKKRISKDTETIIESVINEKYLSAERIPITAVIEEILYLCRKAGIKVPHPNSIRKRIHQLSEYKTMKSRRGRKKANETYGAQYPKNEDSYLLKVVEMDHTKVDIILLDDQERITLGRPYITVAIEVFSRVILGYYLSFNHPSAYINALCIAHAILPKEKFLEKLDVDVNWPCWGKMQTIRTDNGKDFHSNAFKKACEKHNINLEWRPVGEPKAGGAYIERYLGTFSTKLQALPGKTYRNTQEKDDYDAEGKAVMSLSAFEKWLVNAIAVYHHELHEGIKMSPIKKYEEGVFGGPDVRAVGRQPQIVDGMRLKLDFMPYHERTIQQYGVMIDHIRYWGPELNRYIHATVPNVSKKRRIKRKFIFKYDPRDISIIYFLNPDTQQYIPIHYGNTTRPPISIWEHQEAMRLIKERGIKSVDENTIFRHIEEMRRLVEAETRQTKLKSKKKQALRRQAKPAIHEEFKAQYQQPLATTNPDDEEDEEMFTNTSPLIVYEPSK